VGACLLVTCWRWWWFYCKGWGFLFVWGVLGGGCFFFLLFFAAGLDHITGLFQQSVAQCGGQLNSTASKDALSVRGGLVLGVVAVREAGCDQHQQFRFFISQNGELSRKKSACSLQTGLGLPKMTTRIPHPDTLKLNCKL